MKKTISILMVLIMNLSIAAVAYAESEKMESTYKRLGELKIMEGYEDGSLRLSENITRAEMAKIVISSVGLGIEGETKANTGFIDVPKEHWASGYIFLACQMEIIRGNGDRTFSPDENVTGEQAVKMVVCALGYGPMAETRGGYPDGYIATAKLSKLYLDIIDDKPINRGQVAELINEALDIPLLVQVVYGEEPAYETMDGSNGLPIKTLLTEKFGKEIPVTDNTYSVASAIPEQSLPPLSLPTSAPSSSINYNQSGGGSAYAQNKLKGRIMANSVTNLTSSEPITGTNMRPETVKILVDGNFEANNGKYADVSSTHPVLFTFKSGNTRAGDYIGQRVVFSVNRDIDADVDIIVDISPESGKNIKETISLNQFQGIEGFSFMYWKNPISDRKPRSLTLTQNPSVIYNGRAGGTVLPMQKVFGINSFGTGVVSDTLFGETVNSITASGKITLIDSGNTGFYDVILVEVPYIFVVQDVNISKSRITSKNSGNGIGSTLDLDAEANSNLRYRLTKSGKDIAISDVKNSDVLSIVYNDSGNGDYYDIRVISKQINGKVSEVGASGSSWKGNTFTINGIAYEVAKDAYNIDSLRLGSSGTFYVDEYEKVIAFSRSN